MIRIQKLDQPKKTSGKKIAPREILKIRGLEIKNTNKFPLYVTTYKRKPYNPKE